MAANQGALMPTVSWFARTAVIYAAVALAVAAVSIVAAAVSAYPMTIILVGLSAVIAVATVRFFIAEQRQRAQISEVVKEIEEKQERLRRARAQEKAEAAAKVQANLRASEMKRQETVEQEEKTKIGKKIA